jgi:UDP-glucose 4-epimerase
VQGFLASVRKILHLLKKQTLPRSNTKKLFFNTHYLYITKADDITLFNNKILLITGGTGSFGNAMLKRILNTEIKEIRIFSRDEKKQDDMRNEYKNSKLAFYIGDVRDIESVKRAVCDVDYIFHAAALKQVPSCESFPLEALKTNVLGTENMLSAAIQANVKKIICLSTDKAVYPINAMGISKAMMEKIFIAKSKTVNKNKTLICGTRYGNVMASRGSVVPLFIDQIKSGQPITITEPAMTRFLMNLDEAIDLVMFSYENSEQGDLMIKKSPACRIDNLAKALVELFEAENDIVCIGSRPGEKMYESLLTKEESLVAQDMNEFFRIPASSAQKACNKHLINEYNSNNTDQLNIKQIKEKLLSCDYVKNELDMWHKR